LPPTIKGFASGRTGVRGGPRLYNQLADDRDRARPVPIQHFRGSIIIMQLYQAYRTKYLAYHTALGARNGAKLETKKPRPDQVDGAN
jgi:hypothetical protein